MATTGVVGALGFDARSHLIDARSRRVANYIRIVTNHRELWREFYEFPFLQRVLDPAPDLAAKPITQQERIFVIQVILHLSTQFEAEGNKMTVKLQGLRADVQAFLTLPIPAKVWSEIIRFQNPGFSRFVTAAALERENIMPEARR